MDIQSLDDILAGLDSIVEYLMKHEDRFYIALEYAQELRDELQQHT